jgi:hypothetical protein
LTRSLVYDEVVPISSDVTNYENDRKIITTAGYGAVGKGD